MSTYAYGMRFDDDSNAITVIDEENQTAATTGYINGEPVEFSGGGGGSSDFSTAEVTIVNTLEEDFTELFPFLDDNVLRVTPIDFAAGETQVLKMPIPTGGSCVFSTVLIGTVSGDIAFEAGILTITGNGTFTVTGLD